MNDLSPAATRWLADHHGVISAARLRACGVGRSTTLRLVHRGVLKAAHKGVFVLAATNPTLQQRCVVLSLAHPAGFVTGPTAGSLLDLRRMPRISALHFAVRHGLHLPAEHGVRFRQSTKLPSSHRSARDDGIAIAKPARLSFDLAADLLPLDHLSVVQQLLDTNRVTVHELIAMVICSAIQRATAATSSDRLCIGWEATPPLSHTPRSPSPKRCGSEACRSSARPWYCTAQAAVRCTLTWRFPT